MCSAATAQVLQHATAGLHLRTAQAVNAYVAWAQSRWVDSKLHGIHPELASQVVMAMGLAGETGEVVEALEDWLLTGIRDEQNVKKELGDAFYYWASLVHAFKLDGGQMFLGATLTEATCPSKAYAVTAILQLASAQGKVLEATKKYIRDGAMDKTRLEAGMLAFVRAWRVVCTTQGFDWLDVLKYNQEKVESLLARGTLRGSGNDR